MPNKPRNFNKRIATDKKKGFDFTGIFIGKSIADSKATTSSLQNFFDLTTGVTFYKSEKAVLQFMIKIFFF